MTNTNQNTEKNEKHWIKLVLSELRFHIMSIVFIIVLYLLFWVVPQINDLIIVINQAENDWIGVLAFFSSLSVLAILISNVNTYLNPPSDSQDVVGLTDSKISKDQKKKPQLLQVPKDKKELFLESKHKQEISEAVNFEESQKEYIKRIFPKLLGVILILIAAYAVNNTYQNVYGKNISFSGGNKGLLVCLIVLFVTLNQSLANFVTNWFRKIRWSVYIPVAFAIMSLLGILILGVFNQNGSEGDTIRLFYSLILLATLFLLMTVSYDKLVSKMKKYVGVPIIITLVICIFIAFTVLVYNPQALQVVTPLSIVMICIIGIYTILNLIKLLGKHLEIPLLSMVILFTIMLSVITANKESFNHYDASTTIMDIPPSDRLSLETYIDQWIADRRNDILKSNPENKFPIILVSSEGGGSRAGLWSFLVQSYLYERNPDYFEKYMFSMTGASGGGVGNNMFYTQAYYLQNGMSKVSLKYEGLSNNGFKYRASTIYIKDYLSTSVASLFGRDLFKSIMNLFCFKDRGKLLEDEWENNFKTSFEYENISPLAESYLEMMPRLGQYKYIRPLLITNTTNLQTGEYAVISPVCTSEDTNNMGVFMDLLAKYPSDSLTLKRSTAMSLNARFPYVSPAARIKYLGQFGDAGYYDNIGGTVTQRLTKTLMEHLERDSTLIDKYEIKNLLITNFEGISKMTYSSQLTAPASMIWNATFGHPKEMEKTFKNVYNAQSKRTFIKQKPLEFEIVEKILNEDSIKPIIPLGRYLSESAVLSLEARIKKREVTELLDSLIPSKSNGD